MVFEIDILKLSQLFTQLIYPVSFQVHPEAKEHPVVQQHVGHGRHQRLQQPDRVAGEKRLWA